MNLLTCNSLEYHQHHRNDNKNVLFSNVCKVHLYLNSERYKNDILDDPCERCYQDLHILHALLTRHNYTNVSDLEIS